MANVPLYDGALRAAADGVRTGGDARNRAYLDGHVTADVDAAFEAVAFDPQTSGGLLAAVEPTVADDLTDAGFTVIGEATPAGGDATPGVALR
jgi:selenide,water dikinase